ICTCVLKEIRNFYLERKEYVNKKNMQMNVLRASLSLSMLFGVGLHTKHVSAAEKHEETTQKNISPDIKSGGEKLENIEGQETNSKESEKQKTESEDTSVPEDILEDPETLPKDELEESDDSEDVHNTESSGNEEIEDSSNSEENSQLEEELLGDKITDSENENTPTDDEMDKKEVDEEANKDSSDEEQNEEI